jgi:hypothetical protein
MIPIPIVWTSHTATIRGSILKFVPCENCSTEYVYVMKREGSGSGTSLYLLNEQGAAEGAAETAKAVLKGVLENDFDPVPCPVCGHYQRYMFPKLLETKELQEKRGCGRGVFLFGTIAAGFLAGIVALRSTLRYTEAPNDHDLGGMIAAWSVVLLACLIGLTLSILKRVRDRRFDPNSGDRRARIALGRSQAITRAEYEQAPPCENAIDQVSKILRAKRAERGGA